MTNCIEFELPEEPQGVVVRRAPSGDPQTLIFFTRSIHVLEISRVEAVTSISLGDSLDLIRAATGRPCTLGELNEYPSPRPWPSPSYDSATDYTYFFGAEYTPVWRLSANDTISQVPGTKRSDNSATEDEIGFYQPGSLAVGAGSGFADVQVDNELFEVSDFALVGGRISRLSEFGRAFNSLAYHTPSGSLLAASRTALYRFQWARGAEIFLGEEDYEGIHRDGSNTDARFSSIRDLHVAPDGHSLYVMDRNVLRRVDLWTREVSTLIELEAGAGDWSFGVDMAVLPHGAGLAVLLRGQKKVYVVQGLEHSGDPISRHRRVVVDGSAPRELTSQLPLLLQQPESGSALVTLRVGGPSGRVFSAHRSVLCSRSEYFRGLLAGGFREDDSREVELPDVDPYCFAPVLAFMYTGTLGDVLAENLRPTAELFGWLLVPMPATLQQQLMAAATPASMLSDLAWAERLGLRDLARELREAIARQFQAVMEAVSPESLSQVMSEVPDLMTGIVRAGVLHDGHLPAPDGDGGL